MSQKQKNRAVNQPSPAVALAPPPTAQEPAPDRLDLGCGSQKKAGFFGIDQYAMPGVDLVLDLGTAPWPFEDGSIIETSSNHFLEHLDADGRIHFMNELHRVLKPGGTAFFTVPYFGSARAYGDPTHQWPPLGEWFLHYLTASWRKQQAPHTDSEWNPRGYSCDFDWTCGYALHQLIVPRNTDLQQLLVTFCKEAAQDLIFTLTSRASGA